MLRVCQYLALISSPREAIRALLPLPKTRPSKTNLQFPVKQLIPPEISQLWKRSPEKVKTTPALLDLTAIPLLPLRMILELFHLCVHQARTQRDSSHHLESLHQPPTRRLRPQSLCTLDNRITLLRTT